MKVWNYSAGPSMIPVPVMEKAQKEFCDFNGLGMGIVEMSHRSAEYMAVAAEAEQLLRDIMEIPANYKILFENASKIDELLKEDIILDDILSENLFVLSFELLDMIKSDPENYKISDMDNDEKVKAISSIIRKMELSFIEF